ncbi:hypothetical protein Fot_22105 [Forsythia ovata]|uniref:Uncharacterized protein n=1 Tax=Forsythia ovata TaxID=205694 RepID=A0ABD1UWT8_9LAMI
MQLKWLIELSEKQHTPLCITLMRREPPMNRHDVGDEVYRNRDDFWDTVKIARDDVVFSEMNATQRHHEIVQDNDEEFRFTNKDLIASVTRRQESAGHQASPSSRSSCTTQVMVGYKHLLTYLCSIIPDDVWYPSKKHMGKNCYSFVSLEEPKWVGPN